MDHHDNKYTINFKHFPQDANARCHSLEQIILFLDVKSLANFILTSAIAQYDGNSISMFSIVRLNKFKTDMMYELNRKYLDPYPTCTPYIVACELGHFDDFKKFVTIGNIDINSTGKNRTGWNGGYTSLLIATQYEHIDIVKYLLNFDHININASNDSGMSALHTAAYHNANHEITQMFIMHPNLNINSQNSQGWTSLDWALEYNAQNIKLIELLTENGAKRRQELLAGEFASSSEEIFNDAPVTRKTNIKV